MLGLDLRKASSWHLFRDFYEETEPGELDELANHIPKPEVYNKGIKPPPKMDKDTIGEHHFFDLLGRHPLAIILAAKLHASFY